MSTTMEHRGYHGSVSYSAEDKMLHGRIMGIRDMVSFGGTTVRQLEKNFRDAVDEYLAFCAETGKTPNRPFKGSVNVRLTESLHLRAACFAEEKKVKLNAVINDAVEHYLAHAE
ncbi:putative HicB family RNase H-like nuclease [Granulicella aggregans]|uniref:Putative HicB family RNase H-like nuclease n=1 Tax=Granulicella aggregans TaxID=474949 RepID=A0A7W7ZDX5_9BACT|nr:type II toxin-antitoxin system HicB family antitoxin [Granulicella aggregans]MBB5057566.1 putative HicB family RNase H-like nuclease [Granulicella aggregans]